jgi:hypothetical protein
MKAENRVGIFDLFVTHDEVIDTRMMGTRAYIWVMHPSAVDDKGKTLTTVGSEAASYEELKVVVDSLKHDLDVVLKKSRQFF